MVRPGGLQQNPYYGVEGGKTAVYCKNHARGGMVDVKNELCAQEGCGKRPNYGVEGSKLAMY